MQGLKFGGLYFRCRRVLNLGGLYFRCRRVLSKPQLAEVQSPGPHVQTGLRVDITLTLTLTLTRTQNMVVIPLRISMDLRITLREPVSLF